MPSDRACWRRRAILGSLLCAALPAAQGRAEDTQVGKVDDSQGEAFARLHATRRLSSGSGIFLQDLVWTGDMSRARLSLGHQTRLFLGSRTSIAIDRFLVDAGGDLTLGAGALIYDHAGEPPPSGMRIQNGYASLAVRGTRLFAGPSRGEFGVFVEIGQVDVEAAGAVRRLGPGQGTHISHPGAPPGPVTNWPAARVRDAYASVLG